MNSKSNFEILLVVGVSIIFKIVIATSGSKIRFEENEVAYTVLAGESVSLVCEPEDTSLVDISTAYEAIVELGSLVDGWSDELNFGCNVTICTLTILKVERRHENKYLCFNPEKSLVMKVMYSPSGSFPVCNSTYQTGTFLIGPSQKPFIFHCASEEGNPPINMTLSLHYGDGRVKYLTMDPNITVIRKRQSVAVSYAPFLDASFDNVVVVCDVNQQLSEPYPNYTSSCFSERLALPVFSVSITQHSVAHTITLICICNMTGVVLEWTETKYRTSRINDTAIELNITEFTSRGKPLFLQCNGSYGGKIASAKITIGGDSSSEDQQRNTGVIKTAVIVPILLLIFVILLK